MCTTKSPPQRDIGEASPPGRAKPISKQGSTTKHARIATRLTSEKGASGQASDARPAKGGQGDADIGSKLLNWLACPTLALILSEPSFSLAFLKINNKDTKNIK